MDKEVASMENTCKGYLIEKLGRKPTVGIFSLTSCEGCQMRILDLEENLLDIFGLVDIINFHLAKGKNKEGPFDVSFVEGAVVTKKEIEKLKDIRAKSKYLIALGTCASYGGVPSIKDFGVAKEIEREVYRDPSFLDSLENVYGIGHYVEVDYYLISLIIGLRESLRMIKSEGLENVYKRIEVLAQATREGASALGLKTFAKSPSPAVTAIYAPEGIDGQAIYKTLWKKYGVTGAGGQDQLKGKVFRIATLGYADKYDVITAVSALEFTLRDLGYKFQMGAGISAAINVLKDL